MSMQAAGANPLVELSDGLADAVERAGQPLSCG